MPGLGQGSGPALVINAFDQLDLYHVYPACPVAPEDGTGVILSDIFPPVDYYVLFFNPL